MSSKEFRTGRYEFKDPDTGQHKFWMAERVYHTVTIIFGRVGSSGTRASRDFATGSEAQAFIQSRLQDKLDEGYTLAE